MGPCTLSPPVLPCTLSDQDLASCDTWHAAGHSLGGALATLAAHSFATRARQEGATPAVTCYTFGSPRAGNHAFAAEYNQLVPDTWHVINDQVGTGELPLPRASSSAFAAMPAVPLQGFTRQIAGLSSCT